MALLSWISAVLVVLLFLVLALGLIRISAMLRAIGGTPTSYLAKLRLGLRAIDTQTAHLAPQVQQLNGSLGKVAEGLQGVEGNLAGTVEAVRRQEG